MLPHLPVTPDPTSPFCLGARCTGSLAGAALARSVCSRVDTGSWRHPPPPRASSFLSCARRSVPCVEWAGGWLGGRGPLRRGHCPHLPLAGLA